METALGSDFSKISGVGVRVDKETGKLLKVTKFYPDYHEDMIKAFVNFPICKYFGINIDQAMHLPVDRWNAILHQASSLRHDVQESPEERDMKLLELLKIAIHGGGGA